MENENKLELDSWVNDAANESDREFRETVHIILFAISSEPSLRSIMFLKGGVLLAIRYGTGRLTKDIDLSTALKAEEFDQEKVLTLLTNSLALAVEELDYGLDCKIQSSRLDPKHIPNPTFPCLSISIGHAYKGSPKHKKLMSGQSSTVVTIDYSINEQVPNLENLIVSESTNLIAYTLLDIIAEKYRALLQQKSRRRARRQDVFDLNILLQSPTVYSETDKHTILSSLKLKSESRDIFPKREDIRSAELIERAKSEYLTLEQEVSAKLPDFDSSYETIAKFYEELPWDEYEYEKL